jgi:hypothetical protein
MNWTTEQILKLAPDASSAKAGHGLLNLNKWSGLGTMSVPPGVCVRAGRF